MSLNGRTLSVLGLGSIGAMAAQAGRAFGMEMLAWSLNLTEARCAEHGARLAPSLDALRREADVLSLHLAPSDRCRDIVGERQLRAMKPTVFLVNTSRAPLVDREALLRALQEGGIAGAGLGVYEQEPPDCDDPLRRLPNVIGAPHIGYVADGNYRLCFEGAVEDIEAWLSGRPLRVMAPDPPPPPHEPCRGAAAGPDSPPSHGGAATVTPAAEPDAAPPGPGFIFMLTRNDRTVSDASAHLETALEAGVRHIGFKDAGLPLSDLKTLAARIREAGGTSWLEVVSLDRETECASLRAAPEIGVDALLGGTRSEDARTILEGAGIRYFPFPGRISGHPSVLEGDMAEIVASARALAAQEHVHGLDLLAYRGHGPAEPLACAVAGVTAKPVIAAGSIASPAHIAAMLGAGCAGFTIGTAALDDRFEGAGPGLRAQLAEILRVTEILRARLASI